MGSNLAYADSFTGRYSVQAILMACIRRRVWGLEIDSKRDPFCFFSICERKVKAFKYSSKFLDRKRVASYQSRLVLIPSWCDWISELTSVHVPYRNIRIFWYRYPNYRFTRFTQKTRFTRENEAISSASEMSTEVTRPSLADLQKITRKGMKWSWHSG